MTALILFRSRQAGDTSWLRELFKAASPGREFLPENLMALQEQAQRQHWGSVWGPYGETVVEVDGVPAVRIWVVWGAGAVRLVDLSVATARRGQGLARHLLTGLCESADTAGLGIKLSVNADNAVALHLYESFGFHPNIGQGAGDGLSLEMIRAPTPAPGYDQ